MEAINLRPERLPFLRSSALVGLIKVMQGPLQIGEILSQTSKLSSLEDRGMELILTPNQKQDTMLKATTDQSTPLLRKHTNQLVVLAARAV